MLRGALALDEGALPVVAVCAAAAVVLVLLLSGLAWRRRVREARATREAIEQARLALQAAAETQFAEIKGRLSAIVEMTSRTQAEQARSLDERLDHVTARLGETLAQAGRRTFESLSSLNERLALIEDARQSLAALSSEVLSLQGVLSDKQARGAFGQMRMETIVRDALPAGAYEFQATLSNGKRPDCLIRLPNTPAPLVVDSKFPLEGFEALRRAATAEDKKAAAQTIRTAVGRHIEEIAEKYLLAGETQDTALMFVPSESIYGDLHEHFPDLVQKAHRARVVIVAPNILMLAVQTMQAVIKDVKMRDSAGIIQREVGLLLGDVGRLAERLEELERHFSLSGKALEKIKASADKIAARGERIGALDLEEKDEPAGRTLDGKRSA